MLVSQIMGEDGTVEVDAREGTEAYIIQNADSLLEIGRAHV